MQHEFESESESGSRARTPTQASVRAEAEVRAKMWAEAEAKADWARVLNLGWVDEVEAEDLARAQEARALALVRAEAEAEARAERAQAQATAQAQARARAEAEAEERAERARAEAKAKVERARAQAAMLALARAEAEVEAEVWAPRAPAEALGRALAQARAGMMDEAGISLVLPHLSHRPTYDEVLADLKIKDILDSIIPEYSHELSHHLWRHSEHFWLIQIIAPVTRLPPELLYSILNTIIDDDASGPPVRLMLVCKHWYTIVAGIWASFKLGTRTPRDTVARKLERNPWLLDIVVDTEIDRNDFAPSKAAYEAIFAAIEATSRWRNWVVETFPRQTDLPEDLVNYHLQRCSNPTMNCLRSFKIKSACEMSPLLDRLLRILGTTASAELSTVEINSANVISFLVSTYPPFFRSIKVLFLDISGTHDPVDLLPHLHQLETLTASQLFLPNYADEIKLPLVNTLRHLTLRAVSIQWMSGRTFDVLESCNITLAPNRHIPPILGTTLPSCKQLTFQGYPLNILDGISAHKLIHLSVTCPGSFKRRGDRQLVWFSTQVLRENRLAPRILHLSIEATDEAWINALAFMSDLEELVIGSARPSSIGVKVFQSLIVHSVHASNTSATSTPEGWDAPLCPSLRRFGLKYRRWLRTSEHFDLFPTFLSIIQSRKLSNSALQSFHIWRGSDQQDPLELVGYSQVGGLVGVDIVEDSLEII